MYPTKPFDDEEHRQEHAIRHANVLDAIAGEPDIAGSFGWCMFDYNTHKDFGSGDRVCYHGVMDYFRNPKLAAYRAVPSAASISPE
jgi:beta-galactosidase